ncbi:hypothetical protein LJR029_000860 [Caballeronia sp. LjRoot29]
MQSCTSVISTIFSKTAFGSLQVSLDFDALLVQNDHGLAAIYVSMF